MRVRNMMDEIAHKEMEAHVQSATSFYKIASDGIKMEIEKNGRSKRGKTDNSLQRERSLSHDTGERPEVVGEGGIFVEPSRNYP